MTDSKKWLILLLVLVVGLLLYLLAPILTPFLIAGFLAYMADPLADRLEAKGLSRALAATIVFTALMLVLLLLLIILVPLLEEQLRVFIAKVPEYFSWMQDKAIPYVQRYLGLKETALDLGSVQRALLANWQRAGSIMANVLVSISSSGLAVIGWLINLVLIPVVTFYLLRDWDVLMETLRALVPTHSEGTVVRLARQSDEVLGAFLRGQLLVMLGLGTVYSIGLSIVGLDLALLIGMIAGLMSFVPYLGFFVGLLLASVAALVQFQDLLALVYVVIVFGIGQLIEGFILIPLLIGGRIGLHPVAVIFAVLAGGQLFGFFGVLLALPVAAVVRVLLGYARGRYVKSELYGPQPPEIARID
ncbi:MAG: AI-2E family transporter [Gammaproteobacteria bacterium]